MARVTDSLWSSLQKRYDELNEQLISTSIEASQRHVVQKELSTLSTLLNKHQEIVRLEGHYSVLREQAALNIDPEMTTLFNEELATLDKELAYARQSLDILMYPPDPLDKRDALVEIRAGTGGQEAALFVGDLLRMYTLCALKKNWKTTIMSSSGTDLGGFREVVIHIQGNNVYGNLKFESGVHRVQRVPATETAGRIHTSTATIAVLPEADDIEAATVSPADLRIDVYRAGGAGGQHVNTTDSAVRITHLPTGLVVTCQDERSQHKNKEKALKVLLSRLVSAQKEKHESEMSQKRKQLVGTGMRSEKVRTYNFPQNRVTDHTVELTLKKLDMIMEGNLDDILDALREHEQQERKKQPLYS